MSLILNFIRENEDWKQKLEDMLIKIKIDGDLALFKYSSDADKSNPLVQEARGIIIDIKKNKVVCYPFNRFFNYGEPTAAEIDWSSAKVQEKLDGSIIKLFYYYGWRIATNGTINAFECSNSEGYNFGKMVMECFINQDIKYYDFDKNYTYIFELVSPHNMIVVQYPETKLYHIGTRDRITEKEVNMDIGVIKPKEYNLSSLDECIDWLKDTNGSEHEGFVVVDKNFNRVKVKSDDYLRLHYMAGNGILTIKDAINIILNNEIDEYCAYFPTKKELILRVAEKMEKKGLEIMSILIDVKKEDLSRKDCALKYHKHKYFKFIMKYIYNNEVLKIDNKDWEKILKDEVI